MVTEERKLNLALPGNPRYQPKSLQEIFGYDNLMLPVIEVELAGMYVLAEVGIISSDEIAGLTPEVVQQIRAITTSQVDKREREVTKHDIRALVQLIQEQLPPNLKRWVHVGFTSYDPLETGRMIQFAWAHRAVISPKCKEVILILAKLVRKYAKTLQTGRTHGQHAIPITVGFWLATILNRILYNNMQADSFARGLVGKISGAVGASNAIIGLGVEERCKPFSFEARVLGRLGLKSAKISTQILPPEPLAQYLFSSTLLSVAFAQFGRDCRNLMRSEIAEIGEPFAEGQVGSSTMAQKRNPITFENLEGMGQRNIAEFWKVMSSLVSEHQRDLVGSSLARDFPIILVNLVVQMENLLRQDKNGIAFLERLTVNEANCMRNFETAAPYSLAEPTYIALQMGGYTRDAHELVNRKAVPLSQSRENQPLMYSVRMLAEDDEELSAALGNIPTEVIELLEHPESYIRNATAKAIEIAELAELYAT